MERFIRYMLTDSITLFDLFIISLLASATYKGYYEIWFVLIPWFFIASIGDEKYNRKDK